MKKFLLFSFLLMSLVAVAQTRTLTGKVIAQKNNVEKNTMQGKTELDSIQKSVLGKAFYELLSVSENNKWILLKMTPTPIFKLSLILKDL